MPIAEIERTARFALGEPFDGRHMSIREVAYMHIVTYACAVRRRIIITEDLDRGPATHGRKQGKWNEMRLRLMRLAELTVRIGASSVEVAKRHMRDAMSGLGLLEHALDDELRIAIWVHGTLRVALLQGQACRDAVGCAGRGKYEIPATEFLTHLEQLGRAADVVLIDFSGSVVNSPT